MRERLCASTSPARRGTESQVRKLVEPARADAWYPLGMARDDLCRGAPLRSARLRNGRTGDTTYGGVAPIADIQRGKVPLQKRGFPLDSLATQPSFLCLIPQNWVP